MNKTKKRNKRVDVSQRLESLDALRGFDMFWIVGGAWIFGSLHNIFNSPVTDIINTQIIPGY